MTYKKKGFNKKSLKNLNGSEGRTKLPKIENRCIMGCKKHKALGTRFCLDHLALQAWMEVYHK